MKALYANLPNRKQKSSVGYCRCVSVTHLNEQKPLCDDAFHKQQMNSSVYSNEHHSE